MIHELREYTIEQSVAERYFKLFRDLAMPIRGEAFGRLLGNWVVPGREMTFFHLWEYESLADRTVKRAALATIDDWTHKFLPAAAACITGQRITILRPFADAGVMSVLRDAQASRLAVSTFRCGTGQAAAVASAVANSASMGDAGIWIEEIPDPNVVRCVSSRCDAPGPDVRLSELGVTNASQQVWERGPC
ncbi:NIPSNAP family protein [Paraburkholderia sp. RL18-103-BIB-C]|jgi:hypothetical protein|uniref:NIPSNAP family protein n=1 Tax=unclassified Paraburkholderia TaxID=2615204 RepID=UPI0038BA9640